MSERAARLLPSLVPELRHEPRPGYSESRARTLSIAESKAAAEVLIRRAGLADHGSGVKVADILGIDKSTLHGKRDPRAMNRGFTTDELDKLARYATWQDGNAEFSRSA